MRTSLNQDNTVLEAPLGANMQERPIRPQPQVGIAYLIGRLDRALRQLISEAVSAFGLTLQQYTALSVIRSRGLLSNAQLAKRSMMTPQAASEIIKVLEAKGWIERHPDPSHGRIVLIRLTDAGAGQMNLCDEKVAGIEAAMLERLESVEHSRFSENLRGCLHALGPLLQDI